MHMNRISLPTGLKWLFAALEIVLAAWALNALFHFAELGTRNPIRGSGMYWISGIGLRLDPAALHLKAPALAGSTVSLENVFASVGVDLTSAGPLIKSLLWPLCGIVVCRVGVMIALCELFRRMFRSVERREVFTVRNIGRVQKIGLLVIGLTLVSALFERTYGGRVWEFVSHNITTEGLATIEQHLPPTQGMSAGTFFVHGFMINIDEDGVMFGSLIRIDFRGVLLGLGLISFGAALRQGLALKEENELTV